MCVAVAIVAGIGVAGAVSAAKIQSNASKNASKSAGEAGDKALAFQKEQYAQSRKDFDPYAQQGAAAMGRLSTAATAPRSTFTPGRPQQLGQPQGVPPPVSAPPPSASPEFVAGLPMPTPAATPALWTIQSPDGTSQKQLPPDVAQQFIAKGARRVA
jgi:hypothetical protein